MLETIIRICELQPFYSPDNTPQMEERGRLVRKDLVQALQAASGPLIEALGEFGIDFHVDASDGIGRKTELPWARFFSRHMSPSATEGFYVVLHFSTDGSAMHIAVGCSSSKFKDGYSIVLPGEQLDERTAWARRVILEDSGSVDPFTDSNEFGATRTLPKSFQRACALVKTIPVGQLDDSKILDYLILAARFLRAVYEAQRDGRELSPADQDEIDFIQISRPSSNVAKSQGFGLSPADRKAVELRAMDLAREWLLNNAFEVTDTSAKSPYDFEAKKGGQVIFVEVKGTTSDQADAISMTHTEVSIHKMHKGQTALCLVTGIRLERSGGIPKASQGILEVLIGWDIDAWDLKPTTFRVGRKSGNLLRP
jgi:hypothetical protein